MLASPDQSDRSKSQNQFNLILGILISSVGSQCLFIVITVLMPLAGYTFFQVGLFAATGRLATLASNIFLGEISNRFSSRKIVLVSELIGFIATVGIYVTWLTGPNSFNLLLIWMAVRSFSLAIQAPSRSYLLKVWNADNAENQSRGAIWLNKVTQGSIVFAAILSVPIVAYGDIRYAIVLDLITFSINGLIVYFMVEEVPVSAGGSTRKGYFDKFHLFFSKTPELWLLDVCLLVGITGTNTLFVKIAGDQPLIGSTLHIIAGGSVWVTGYLHRLPRVQRLSLLPWCAIVIGFASLALVNDGPLYAICASAALIFCSNWLLFYRISALIQNLYPANEIAAVTSARMAQINLIVIIGELLVGLSNKWFSVSDELFMRSIFLSVVAAGLIIKRLKDGIQSNT